MKKLLLLIFVAALSCDYCAAQTPQPRPSTIINVKKINKSKGGRSVVIAPTVYVDADACQLTISMVSGDSYVVYVYDGSGGVVYQGSVVTDGSRQVYLLPELEADLYSISIESNSAAYEGEFYIN